MCLRRMSASFYRRTTPYVRKISTSLRPAVLSNLTGFSPRVLRTWEVFSSCCKALGVLFTISIASKGGLASSLWRSNGSLQTGDRRTFREVPYKLIGA
ncbi:hypothetical protein K402DRAFT_111883 [Aulographum hederae CBS 113979]|uniref:Uncharacterized protein n=1 Tax=Aulographum hederae CBS 113979 TaxID=1176131 RepID=A0A6G1GWT2_9PEZI|nr:hypothetical protein K402DRAFT_111883 [Aulographum hederae CBS 113979]